jgi:hypothetical protein
MRWLAAFKDGGLEIGGEKGQPDEATLIKGGWCGREDGQALAVELDQRVSSAQRTDHDFIKARRWLRGELDARSSAAIPDSKWQLDAQPVRAVEIDSSDFSSEET